MGLLFAIFLLRSVSSAQLSAVNVAPQQNEARQPASSPEGLPGDLLALPQGKSTVIGGTITDVDPIADRLNLKVFGGRSMKILFDERTQVYRDGVKTSLRDLHANDRASVETMLDGTAVFARSVHILSHSPQGECQGQVTSYDPGTGELTVNESLSNESIRLRVPAGTAIVRKGQAASNGSGGVSDLVKGTLISAEFVSDNNGKGIASQITILAIPGSAISFSGNVSFVDLRSKEFVVADAQSDESYKISFDPSSFPVTRNLHEGAHVKVKAEFDGTRYVAREITVD